MFEWKVEEMALKKQKISVSLGRLKTYAYSCENSVSREDKIAFVDSMQDGILSYLLSLIEKFNTEKENMPKKERTFGEPEVKTTSLKAWIKRNDTKYSRPIIDDWYNYGKYEILGCERSIQNSNKGTYDYYDDLVDECFRRQLAACEAKEETYFLDHDEYSILRKKVEEKSNQYRTSFDVHIIYRSSGEMFVADDNGNQREITFDELNELVAKYEQLDDLVEKLTSETHIVY